jgi:hypothetical protein
LAADLAPLSKAVARINSNGGQVVFLRLPSSGARLRLEESHFSTDLYFDLLIKLVRARCVDFRDFATRADFDCPDDSHLSVHGARAFTLQLLSSLFARDLTAAAFPPHSVHGPASSTLFALMFAAPLRLGGPKRTQRWELCCVALQVRSCSSTPATRPALDNCSTENRLITLFIQIRKPGLCGSYARDGPNRALLFYV